MKRFFIVLISVFIFLLYIKNVMGQSNLVGYWKFDEGTGSTASDSSGYGNDGTIVASGRNQVNNPSFEMGKQDWGSGSGTWDIVSDEKYHEVNSSRFQDLIGDAGSEYAGNVYIPVNPDEAITISAYSKGDNIVLGSQSWHRALLVGRWINSTGHNLCDNNPAICPAPYTPWPDMLLGDGTGTWDWKRSTITRIPPPTAVEYRFSVGLRGSGTGTLWVDAVQVENGGTATDFTDTPWVPPSDSVSGQSLEFDGRDDYVNLGDKFDDLPISGSSILWWAKFSDNTTPTTQRFWGKHTNFEVRWPSGTQVIHFDVGGTDTLTTGISFEEDKWYHLAFVWNSTDSSFYVDGTYMADGNPVASLPQTADEFHIGEGGINRGTQNFNGIMDEFKIYNRTLSSTEIYNEYQLGITPTTTTTTTTSSTTTTLGPPSYDFNMWAEGPKLFTIGKQEIFNVYIQNNGNTDDSYTISYSKQALYETQDVSHLIDVSLRSNRINKIEPNRTGNTFATVILKGPISSGSITFNASSISNPSLKSTANPVEITTGYSINLPEFGLMGLMLLILISSLIISYSSHFR